MRNRIEIGHGLDHPVPADLLRPRDAPLDADLTHALSAEAKYACGLGGG